MLMTKHWLLGRWWPRGINVKTPPLPNRPRYFKHILLKISRQTDKTQAVDLW